MALARVKTWNAGDTLTAADLNAEYNNILNNPTALINLTAAGDVCIVSSAAAVTRLAIGTAPQALTVSTGLLPAWSAPILQSYLAGCQITAVGGTSSGTLTHSSGVAVDGTNVTAMVLSSALIGTTTGAFVAGNSQPKLQVSPLAASTSYHIYVISSVLGGSVDVLYSSSTSPTLPTGFTKSRRVGSFFTGATGNILTMTQDGDFFQLDTPIQDANVNNPGVAAVLRTLTVPSGVNVLAHMSVYVNTTLDGFNLYLSDPALTDNAPTATIMTLRNVTQANAPQVAQIDIRSNVSAQIRTRLDVSTTSITYLIDTLGWFDSRGRTA